MKSSWIVLVLAVAASTACEPQPAVEEETPAEEAAVVDAAAVEDSIRAVNARFERAVLEGDSVAVADLYTDDGVLLAPGAPRVEGRAGIRTAFGSMIAGMREFDLETDRVEVTDSGETAWEIGSYALVLETPDGGTIRDEGKYLVVWERVDGTWRLAADMFNSDFPPGGASPPDTTAAAPDTTA